jgi:hypothetical protein
MSDYNLEQPHALPHVPTETVYICPAQSELAPVRLLDSTALDAIECAERVLSVCYTFYRHRSVWETAKGTDALEKIRKLKAVLSNSVYTPTD